MFVQLRYFFIATKLNLRKTSNSEYFVTTINFIFNLVKEDSFDYAERLYSPVKFEMNKYE